MQNKAQDDDLVMSLVEMALARPADQRASYLENACEHDSQLFEEVWKYVEAEERMKGFLLDPLVLPAPERGFEPGELLNGRFAIVREVGQGGMGIVYEAVDQRLEDRRIAIKCAKAGFHKRLPPEVRHATEISHPNVCKIFEIHTAYTDHGEIDFVTMEFLDGETLAERLRRGRLPEKEARTIAQQLCAGLAAAHRNGVIHGDLKSNNVILVTAPDGAIRAVITDFGLARGSETAQRTAQSGTLAGTPDYMAPELWKGEKATVESDIYALGVILFELASGEKPFPSSPELPWEERLTRKPAALKHRWHRTVDRCLDPDPAHRCASVAEIAVAVAPSHRVRRWTMAAAAIVAAIVGAVVYSNVTAQHENVRLAVLPFETDAGNRALTDGLLNNTSDQLRRVKGTRTKQLTVVSLADAVQSKVDRPEKASKLLGATHILTGTLRWDKGRALVHVTLADANSRLPLKEWDADYQPDKLRDLPVALAAIVTGTFRFPPLAVVATVSPTAYADFTRGVGLLQRNMADAALPLLESAVKADPDSPLTHARLAEAQLLKYQLTNDATWLNQAILSFGNARQRNPDLAEVWFVSAVINENVGAYETARDDLRRALEIEPQNGEGWRYLGRIYQESNHFADALAAYRKGVEVQPGHFKNYQGLCSLYPELGNYEEGIPQCLKLVALAPDFPSAHLALASAYGNWGHYGESENESRVALSLDPTSTTALQGLAVALAYQMRYDEAISCFERALQTGSATHLLYLNLGTTLLWAGRSNEAREAYRKGLALAKAVLARNSRDGNVHARLAYLYAQVGERDHAEDEAAIARQLSERSANVVFWLVRAYQAMGEGDRALSIAQDAPSETLRRLRRQPDFADSLSSPRFQELMQSHHIK